MIATGTTETTATTMTVTAVAATTEITAAEEVSRSVTRPLTKFSAGVSFPPLTHKYGTDGVAPSHIDEGQSGFAVSAIESRDQVFYL